MNKKARRKARAAQTRALRRLLKDQDDEPFRKALAPEEKAALTCGRISGRSSLAQQNYLAKLGVPRERSITWTKYRASQEITRRQARQGNRNRTDSGTVPARSNGQRSIPVMGAAADSRPAESCQTVAGDLNPPATRARDMARERDASNPCVPQVP